MSWALDPVGGRIGRWLFSGYALAVLLMALKTYRTALPDDLVAPGSIWFHLFVLSAVALLGIGPRRLLLGVVGGLALRCTISNHVPAETLLWFPAAEWPLYIALPWASAVLPVAPVFRISHVAALGFAGLHKLNSDFFDPVVTCNRLQDRLTTWWSLPEGAHGWVTPGVVVALELGTPLLLILRPRVGVLVATALLLQFVNIGATGLSLLVLVTALAFLEESDLDLPPWVLLAGLPAAAVSWGLYQGPWSWPQYGISHALFAVVGTAAITQLYRRGPGVRAALFPHPALFAFAMMWLGNGLAPYAGLKFQYSFAMLSNLRVDSDRQNSMWAPHWIQSDPHVHVQQVQYLNSGGGRLSGGTLTPDLWSRRELIEHRARAGKVQETLTFRGTWRGTPVGERDLDTLPSSPLFQDHLTAGAPQQCVH